VFHGLSWGDALSMVVLKHLSKQVNSFVSHQRIVLSIDKLIPGLTGVVANNVIVVTVQRHVVLLHIRKKLVCP